MEQKKILWIIASVGIFLLVVMGAALIINRPAQAVEPAIASLQSPNDTWIMPSVATPPVEATADEAVFETQEQLADDAVVADETLPQNGDAVQGLPVGGAKVDTMTVYSGTTNVYGSAGTTTIDLNSIKEAVQQASVTGTNQAGANAVAAAKPVAPAVEKTAPAKVNQVKPVQSKPVAKAEPARSTKKIVDQYWVQVASVTNKKNADNARYALSENKIESEIFTHTADDGKIFYRLRVGPYTTKTEAEYWKGRIALIEEFADTQSYITNTAAKKQ